MSYSSDLAECIVVDVDRVISSIYLDMSYTPDLAECIVVDVDRVISSSWTECILVRCRQGNQL